MLTVHSLRRLVIKRIAFAVAIAVFTILILVAAANAFLASYQSRLARYLGSGFRTPVSIGSVTYLFPDKISLNKVRIFKNIRGANRPVIVIRHIIVPFDIGRFVFRREFTAHRAIIRGWDIFFRESVLFWRENGKSALNCFSSVPGVKRFVLDADGTLFVRTAGATKKINFYNRTILRPGSVDSFGNIDLGQGSNISQFSYSVSFSPGRDGSEIRDLKIASDGFYSTLWGGLVNNKLSLNGYCQNTPPILPSRGRKGILSLYNNRFRGAKLLGGEQDIWNIYDISTVLEFVDDKIHFDHFSFSLNGILFKFAGDLVFGDSVKVDLTCAANDLSVALKGRLLDNLFNGSAHIVYAQVGKDGKTGSENTDIIFDDLRFDSLGRSTRLHCGGLNYTYQAQAALRKLYFNDIDITAELSAKKKQFQASADIYDGFCEFNGSLTPGGRSFLDCDIGITAVSIENLRSLLPYFESVEGRLNGRMRYRTGVDGDFSGHLVMGEGSLRDFSFFSWLADTFFLDKLRKIDFTRLSLDFFVAENIVKITDIDLKAHGVEFSGYYNIDTDMVSSKISLSMDRALLKDSPKFSPLLSLVGSGFNAFTFDFQLSGISSSVNFKWLDSEFKKRLSTAIPGFIERGIEKKVEAIISSGVEKNPE